MFRHHPPRPTRRPTTRLTLERLEGRAVPSVTGLDFDWTRQFGTPAADQAPAVAVEGADAVYVAGFTGGTLPGQASAGELDAYLRKYDAGGNELWTRQFGTAVHDTAWAVAVDATSFVYVVGLTTGALPGQSNAGSFDTWLRKYDADGNEVWTRQFGSAGFDRGRGVVVDESGSVYVTGWTTGALPGHTSAGGSDAFVRKYDADGDEVWTRQFGTTSGDTAFQVALDSAGSLYLAGYTNGKLPGQTRVGGQDGYVRKYDSDGNEVWTDQFGTFDHDGALDIAVDDTGVYAVGFEDGVFLGDAYVRKYDAEGNVAWTDRFGTPADDAAWGVALDETGVYVGGSTEGTLPGQTSAGGQDAFVRKYDADGNEVETLQFGSAGEEQVGSLAVDGVGSVYVAGSTTGTLAGQTSAGGRDAFLVKLSTPAARVAGLLAEVDRLVAEGELNAGQGQALRATLGAALARLGAGNAAAAAQQLGAFAHQVEALALAGILSEDDEERLLDAAWLVIDRLDA